jgi:hypothetical protein
MIKLIQPANDIVQQKKKQMETKTQKDQNPKQQEGLINDKNYHEYCILVYDFFKMNSEDIKVMSQVQTYIERGEGKE